MDVRSSNLLGGTIIVVVLVTECGVPDRTYRLDQKLSRGSIPLTIIIPWWRSGSAVDC